MDDPICIIGGYCTLAGALIVLRHEGITITRRTVLNWINRNSIPKTLIGNTLVIPQWALGKLVADYK